jgi:hypothetical protein
MKPTGRTGSAGPINGRPGARAKRLSTILTGLSMKVVIFAIPATLFLIGYGSESFATLLAALSALLIAALVHLRAYWNGFLTLISITMSLSLGEALLPLLEEDHVDDVSFYDVNDNEPTRYWGLHPTYGVLPVAGVYRATKHTDGHGLVYDAVYSIGNDGFRYTPQSHSKSGKQAFFLGASETFGIGLNDDQTLPYYWAKLNPEYHVTNVAGSGWGPHQAYVLWRETVSYPGAIVFVQTAPWHAERSACAVKFSGLSPRFVVDGDKLVNDGKCRVLLGSKYLGVAASDYLGRVFMKSWFVQKMYDAIYYRNMKEKIQLYLTLIREMKRLADERRQCLVLAFNRAEERYFAGTKYDNEYIIALLGSEGLQVAEVSLANPIEDLDPAYYIANDGHPSDLANRTRAEILSRAAGACAASRHANDSVAR